MTQAVWIIIFIMSVTVFCSYIHERSSSSHLYDSCISHRIQNCAFLKCAASTRVCWHWIKWLKHLWLSVSTAQQQQKHRCAINIIILNPAPYQLLGRKLTLSQLKSGHLSNTCNYCANVYQTIFCTWNIFNYGDSIIINNASKSIDWGEYYHITKKWTVHK